MAGPKKVSLPAGPVPLRKALASGMDLKEATAKATEKPPTTKRN
jgi:hypothetical protein